MKVFKISYGYRKVFVADIVAETKDQAMEFVNNLAETNAGIHDYFKSHGEDVSHDIDDTLIQHEWSEGNHTEAELKAMLEKQQKNHEQLEDIQRATDFCEMYLCDLEGDLTPVDVVNHIHNTGELPEDVMLWQPFEHYEPRVLLKEFY